MNIRFLLAALAVSSCGVLYADYSTPAIVQVKQNSIHGKEFDRLAVNWQAPKADKEKARQAWKIISDWQKDGKADTRKLNVVYVTLKDRPALKGYKERMDRIAKNIQVYYADQMKENGFPPLTFALDMDKNGKVVVHDAYLDVTMDTLDVHSSGGPTREVAVEALKKAGIDASRNYMLVVVQLPDKKGPYYGMGTSEFGCCWICDGEHLDTVNFKSLEKGEYRFGSLGKDNTVYIGGTAHELGHCFSLPHTMNMVPASVNGTSLMGSGNYTYAQELRGEGKGTYLIQSDALRLASIPLFTGKDKAVGGHVVADVNGLKAEKIKNGLRISGKVASHTTEGKSGEKAAAPPVYGMVAYYDPAGGNDYDATTTTCVPAKDGSFSMDIERPGHKGVFELRLVSLMADGKTSMERVNLTAGENGVDVMPLELQEIMVDVSRLWQKNDWKGASAALDKVLEKHGNKAEFAHAFSIWKSSVSPKWGGPTENIPSQVDEGKKELDLVQAKPLKAASGWWSPFWNSLPPNPAGPVPMFAQYTPVQFMYTHATGEFSYDLGGKWKQFSAVAGLPVGHDGTVVLTVKADGKEIFKSNALKEGDSQPLKLDVTGVNTLTLEIGKASPGQADNGNWCVIGDPVLSR